MGEGFLRQPSKKAATLLAMSGEENAVPPSKADSGDPELACISNPGTEFIPDWHRVAESNSPESEGWPSRRSYRR
jgi:hypothetical protein